MTLKYRDRSILDDAVTLIVHHMKRQTSLHKEDKQKIKELLYHFMPDLFFMPRGELSDDEQDKDEDSEYLSVVALCDVSHLGSCWPWSFSSLLCILS